MYINRKHRHYIRPNLTLSFVTRCKYHTRVIDSNNIFGDVSSSLWPKYVRNKRLTQKSFGHLSLLSPSIYLLLQGINLMKRTSIFSIYSGLFLSRCDVKFYVPEHIRQTLCSGHSIAPSLRRTIFMYRTSILTTY